MTENVPEEVAVTVAVVIVGVIVSDDEVNVPPVVASLSTVLPFWHMLRVPCIVPGNPFTVTFLVAKHPSTSV